MSGGSSNSNRTTSETRPWAAQQPYLRDIFEQAQNLHQNNQPTFFPGQTNAPFNPLEQQAQGQLVDAAQGSMQGLANQAGGAQNFLLNDVMNMNSNPYMAQAMQAAVDPIYQRLERQTLPGIGSGAVAGGQYGGSRQGIAEGLAMSDANRLALNTTSQMANDMYSQNLDSMVKGLALSPQTMGLQTAPGQTLGAVGEQQRAMEQAGIDEAMQRHAFEQNAPWDTLAAYQSLIQGNYGGSGTTTGPGTSSAQRLLGAAGTGLSTYAGMNMLAAGPGMAMLGPAAPFVAGGMALLSLFG